MSATSQKACTACGERGMIYSPDKRAKDGLQSRCRKCCREADAKSRDADRDAFNRKSREYYAANRERVEASNNKWRMNNQDKVKSTKRAAYLRRREDPTHLAKRAAYTAVNKDHKSDYDREYRARNPERCAANSLRWRLNNPLKRKVMSRQYKARRRSQEDAGISGGTLAAWTREQPKVCFYCNASCDDSFHVDHFVPLAKGGAHVLTNLRIACPTCNLRKNAKMPNIWIEETDRVAANDPSTHGIAA